MLGMFHVNCSGIDKISGLDAGVDYYVVKTVDLQELFATILILLR